MTSTPTRPSEPPKFDELPCVTAAIEESRFCPVHNSYWSPRQRYCEIILTKLAEAGIDPND